MDWRNRCIEDVANISNSSQDLRGQSSQRGKKDGRHYPDYPLELPEVRRLIEITDYDTSIPVTHQIELYRSNRIDCYKAWIDGKLWKERIGWSKIFEGLRKAPSLCLR